MTNQEFFYKLTPEVIIEAVENAGFATTGLCWKLNSLENRVYDLELEDRSHVVAKFYRPGRWNEAQIAEEHEFLFDLVEHEVPVCAPLKFSDGSSFKQIEGIYYAVWQRTGGRCIDEFSNDHLANLGRLIGRIHLIGKKKEAPNRLRLTSENMGLRPLQFLNENDFIPPEFSRRYNEAVKTVCAIYDDLSRNVPFHRIHGDCHIGNLLHQDLGFFFLDFDDFYTGPAVQDFWMLFSLNDPDSITKLNVFLEGYNTFSRYDEKWLDLIEPLRALRFIHYAGWIAKRWEDPAFKEAFSHFGTEEYWLQETIDLEEQIALIEKKKYFFHDHKVDVVVEETEPELTNKDIFWDWEGD